MMIISNMDFFHPRSKEQNHEPPVQCMYCHFEYSNQCLAPSADSSMKQTRRSSEQASNSSNHSRNICESSKISPFISRKRPYW